MYKCDGIKERFEQLRIAKPSVKYRGLKSLDNVISLELNEALTREQTNLLLTYRRKTRLALRNLIQKSA